MWQAPPLVLMLEGAVVDVDVDLDGHMEQVKEEEAPPFAATTCTGIVSMTPPRTTSEVGGRAGIAASPGRVLEGEEHQCTVIAAKGLLHVL